MGCMVVVTMSYMAGGTDAVDMFHNGSSLCSVCLDNHLKIDPINAMERYTVPLESMPYVVVIGWESCCHSYSVFELSCDQFVLDCELARTMRERCNAWCGLAGLGFVG